MTVEELIKLSMQEMQVIDFRETPTPEEYELGIKRLNTLIASLQNDMIFLTYQDTQEITTVAGQDEYVSAINTHKIRHFSDSTVNVISRKGSDQFRPSDDNGRVNIFVEYNYNPPIIKFAVAPTVTGTVFQYRRDKLLFDIVSGQKLPLRNNAIEMLILGLAYKLCPSFGVEVARRDSMNQDFQFELNKYRSAQTFRTGDEVVAPVGVV